jgi:hypothetical protein
MFEAEKLKTEDLWTGKFQRLRSFSTYRSALAKHQKP